MRGIQNPSSIEFVVSFVVIETYNCGGSLLPTNNIVVTTLSVSSSSLWRVIKMPK